MVGEEFQRVGVRCAFGLNEDGAPAEGIVYAGERRACGGKRGS